MASPGPRRAMPRRRKLLFASIILLGLYGTAEVATIAQAYRSGPLGWSWWYWPHGFVKYRLKPGLDVRAEVSRYKTRVRTNSLGFRGPDVARVKPQGVVRIICVGGSTTFGTGTSGDETTYPARLQAHLRRRFGERVEVINAGVPGWTSTHTMIYVLTRLIYLDPDILLVYHACNDMARESRAEGTPFDELGEPWEHGPIDKLMKYSLAGRAITWAKRWMRGRLQPAVHAAAATGGRGFARRNLEVWRNNLWTIASACEMRGIRPVFLTFAYNRKLLRDEKPEDIIIAAQGQTGTQIADGLDAFNREMRSWAKTRGLAVLEHGMPPDGAGLWCDAGHMNDEGCERFAAHLAGPVGDMVAEVLDTRARDGFIGRADGTLEDPLRKPGGEARKP